MTPNQELGNSSLREGTIDFSLNVDETNISNSSQISEYWKPQKEIFNNIDSEFFTPTISKYLADDTIKKKNVSIILEDYEI